MDVQRMRKITGRETTTVPVGRRLLDLAVRIWPLILGVVVLLSLTGTPGPTVMTLLVIASATNERQVLAIVDAVEEALLNLPEKAKPVRREGERQGRWVLLDYVDIVVHIQHAEEREFYALDRLWKDCPSVPFVDRDMVDADATGAA